MSSSALHADPCSIELVMAEQLRASRRREESQATLDVAACCCTAVMTATHIVFVNTRPVPLLYMWLFALAYALPVVALRMLGFQRYSRLRPLLLGVARVLIMHSSLSIGIGQGQLPTHPGTLSGFSWHLLLLVLAITQWWITLAFRLPLSAHVLVTLVSMTDFLAAVPAMCPAPPDTAPAMVQLPAPARDWLLAAGAGGGSSPWLLFQQARGSFTHLAELLDMLFWAFRPAASMADVHAVSDAALCYAVLAWSHLIFTAVGSTAMTYIFEQQGLGVGFVEGAGGQRAGRGEEASRGPGGFHETQRVGRQGPPAQMQPCPVARTLLCCVYVGCALWCVLRVATVKLL